MRLIENNFCYLGIGKIEFNNDTFEDIAFDKNDIYLLSHSKNYRKYLKSMRTMYIDEGYYDKVVRLRDIIDINILTLQDIAIVNIISKDGIAQMKFDNL